MSQNCQCDCGMSVSVPVRGFSLSLDTTGIPSGSLPDYSTEEQWTGRRWIDGKKIYQKTVVFGPLPAGAARGVKKDVPYNIDNVHRFIHFEAMSLNPSLPDWITLPHINTNPDPSTSYSVHCGLLSSDIRVMSWYPAVANYSETYFTLFYTCSDR